MMIRTAMLTMFILASLMIPALVKSSNLVLAQPPGENTTSAVSPESAALIKKILSASSFSNIQTISFVKGIEVSGVNLGDSDISITLKRSTSENNASNISTPVTVTAVKFPGSSIKDVLTLVEASAKLRGENTPGPLAGMMEKMGGLLGTPNGSNASDSTKPLQALMQLGLNTQMGVGNIVGGDWKAPRTVTTGLLDLGELLGMGSNPSPNAKAHFIMIFVVPYVGKTTLGSVPLK
jgi:hypothetical protein